MSVDDTRSFLLDRTIIILFYITVSVNRLTECIDYSSYKRITDRNTGFFLGTNHFGSFFDSGITTKKNNTNLILSDILNHSFDSVFKGYDLAIHCMINSVYGNNSITDPDDLTCLTALFIPVDIFDLTLNNGDNICCTNSAQRGHLPVSFLCN